MYNECIKYNVLGTILLANEGINGAICADYKNINTIIKYIKTFNEFFDVDVKISKSDNVGFHRLKIKIKSEIVTIGDKSINPNKLVGEHISPKDWNQLMNFQDIVIIDTRNNYETSIGTFPKSIIPNTKSFRDFPSWANNFAKTINKDKKIGMFCTGGIRCEKASSYMKKIGFKNVFHLKGGILKYFEETNKDKNLWEGECFVFDKRVSLSKSLTQGNYKQCFACKMPITDQEITSEKYLEGVSCPNCWNKTSNKQKERFSQRQKQIFLSKNNGFQHIGQDTPSYKNYKKVKNRK